VASRKENEWIPRSVRAFGGMSRCSPFAFLMARPVVMRAIAFMSVSPSRHFRKKVRSLYLSCWCTFSSCVFFCSGMCRPYTKWRARLWTRSSLFLLNMSGF
jgi:hypothetical protein